MWCWWWDWKHLSPIGESTPKSSTYPTRPTWTNPAGEERGMAKGMPWGHKRTSHYLRTDRFPRRFSCPRLWCLLRSWHSTSLFFCYLIMENSIHSWKISCAFWCYSPFFPLSILMKMLSSHDWPDADCITILSGVRKAMAPHSRVLVRKLHSNFARTTSEPFHLTPYRGIYSPICQPSTWGGSVR